MGFGLKGIANQIKAWLSDGASATVSPANEINIRYNTSLQRVEGSTNGGPYLPFAFGSGKLMFTNIAQMAAFDDTTLPDEAPCNVDTLRCDWELVKGSAVTPDGISIVQALSATANWHRCDTIDNYWSYQDTWYVDQAGIGDDEANGFTALTPLKTHDELVRRIGKHLGIGSGFYVVNFVGDYTGNLDWSNTVSIANTTIEYDGVRTILYSGSATAVTPYNPATSTIGTITDTAIPVSWSTAGPAGSSLIGEMIIATNNIGGINGYIGFVEIDNGAKTAEYHIFGDGFGSFGNPAVIVGNGTTFNVVSLTKITGNFQGGVGLFFEIADINLIGSFNLFNDFCNAETSIFKGPVSASNSNASFGTCRFDSLSPITCNNSYVSLDGCAIESSIDSSNSLINNVFASPDVTGGVYITGDCTDWCIPGHGRGYVMAGDVTINFSVNFGAFHMTAAGVGIHTDCGQIASIFGLFWGSDSSPNYGLVCEQPSMIRYNTTPTYGPCSAADCLVGTLPTSYASLPVAVPVDGCAIVYYPSLPS